LGDEECLFHVFLVHVAAELWFEILHVG
jgi:hypothetical protein